MRPLSHPHNFRFSEYEKGALRGQTHVIVLGSGQESPNLNPPSTDRIKLICHNQCVQLSIPRAVPLVYDLDEDFEPIRSTCHVSVGPQRGHFLGDAEELRAALEREGMQLGPGVGGGVAAPGVAIPSSKVGPTEDHPFVL